MVGGRGSRNLGIMWWVGGLKEPRDHVVGGRGSRNLGIMWWVGGAQGNLGIMWWVGGAQGNLGGGGGVVG